MNSKQISKRFGLVVILLATALVSAQVVRAQTRTAGPAAVVNNFYRFHFKHGMGFDAPSVRRRQRWFTPELYALLLAELRKPVAPDEVPYFNGDPFTDTQEYPSTFRVGPAALIGAQARVPVTLLWLDGKKEIERRTLHIELRRGRAGWQLANFVYPDNRNLLGELQRKH